MLRRIMLRINEEIRRIPLLRNSLKRIYQIIGWILSDKETKITLKSLVCISDKNYENLFGYYDKSPWNNLNNKMIYLRVEGASRNAASSKKAYIILNDLLKNEERIIAETSAWNVQQGCMLQWLGPDKNSKIIYNDYREEKLCSVILNIETGEEKVLSMPIYSVDEKGENALSLDFFRLHRLRPGYGYLNRDDYTLREKCPGTGCIWLLNLKSGEKKEILTYQNLKEFEPRKEMENAEHKVNHIMINPDGTRFMFLHRWIVFGKKYTRLLTCDLTGKNLYNLLDEDMISHCNWKNTKEILAWAHTKEGGNSYYLLKDKTKNRCKFGENILIKDGHPSYSPDGKLFLTDSYPTFKRKQEIYLGDEKGKNIKKIGEIYANLKYNNEMRCDLHPRFSPNGKYISFDGTIDKKRQVYILEI